eukprot:3211846-Rhodomonas_salina.7
MRVGQPPRTHYHPAHSPYDVSCYGFHDDKVHPHSRCPVLSIFMLLQGASEQKRTGHLKQPSGSR